MQKTSRASNSGHTRRSIAGATLLASTAILVAAGGCQSELTGASTIGAVSTSGAAGSNSAGTAGRGGATGSGGSTLATGGSTVTGGTLGNGGSVTGSAGMASGGSIVGSSGGSGGVSGGGASSGGATGGVAPGQGGVSGSASGGGGGGAGGKPCVDVEPPPDPKWPGATCVDWATTTPECDNSWFAEFCDVSCGRCVPEPGSGGGGNGAGGGTSGPVDCSGEGLPNVTGGDGYATRYWDCCQTHCAQFNGHRCGQDGTSSTGNNQSSCTGGGAFACYDEAPRAVSDCLSYGHIAKANPNCGGCYRIQFTGEGYHNANDPGSKLIKGKQMIVKVTNTGGDVAHNQFDLMIPGGGVGQFNACSRQWGTNDLGAQYGGFLTNCMGGHEQKKECVRKECMKIPDGAARKGCLWFVDWMQVADNPKFTSQMTDCPF